MYIGPNGAGTDHIPLLFHSLQPENILLYRKGRLDIKIADFGLSVQVKEGQEMKTLVGTAEYVCKLLHLSYTCGPQLFFFVALVAVHCVVC